MVEDDFLKVACLKLEESEGTGGGGPTISIIQRLKENELEREYE